MYDKFWSDELIVVKFVLVGFSGFFERLIDVIGQSEDVSGMHIPLEMLV